MMEINSEDCLGIKLGVPRHSMDTIPLALPALQRKGERKNGYGKERMVIKRKVFLYSIKGLSMKDAQQGASVHAYYQHSVCVYFNVYKGHHCHRNPHH